MLAVAKLSAAEHDVAAWAEAVEAYFASSSSSVT